MQREAAVRRRARARHRRRLRARERRGREHVDLRAGDRRAAGPREPTGDDVRSPEGARQPRAVRALPAQPTASPVRTPGAVRSTHRRSRRRAAAWPAPGGTGLATRTLRSSTGAELPAASITLTCRWCTPFVSLVVSNATSLLSDATHGFTYRNAASPSLVPPTSLQRPPFSSSSVRCSTLPVHREHRLVDAAAGVRRAERHVARARNRWRARQFAAHVARRRGLRAVRGSGRRRRGRRPRRSCLRRLGFPCICIQRCRRTRQPDTGESRGGMSGTVSRFSNAIGTPWLPLLVHPSTKRHSSNTSDSAGPASQN